MHKVSDALVAVVKKQDDLVEGLLQLLLNVMKNVHETNAGKEKGGQAQATGSTKEVPRPKDRPTWRT
eukprot:15523188-Heterocapsa_arctica.AAC.1